MKSATYFAEITNQKAEKYLFECGKLESYFLALLLAFCQLKNFSRVCWKLFRRFWPIKQRNLSHVVKVVPIFTGIYFYHSFYGMISRFKSNLGEGEYFYV